MNAHAIHISRFPYYTRNFRADKRLHCRTLQFEALEERDFLSVNAPIIDYGSTPVTSPWTNPAELHAPAEISSNAGNVEFPETFQEGNAELSPTLPPETAAEVALLDTVFTEPASLQPVTVEVVPTTADSLFAGLESSWLENAELEKSELENPDLAHSGRGNSAWGNSAWGNSAWGNSAWENSAWGNSAWGNSAWGNSAWGNSAWEPIVNGDGVEDLLTELTQPAMKLTSAAVSQVLATWEPAGTSTPMAGFRTTGPAAADFAAQPQTTEGNSPFLVVEKAASLMETPAETVGSTLGQVAVPGQVDAVGQTAVPGQVDALGQTAVLGQVDALGQTPAPSQAVASGQVSHDVEPAGVDTHTSGIREAIAQATLITETTTTAAASDTVLAGIFTLEPELEQSLATSLKPLTTGSISWTLLRRRYFDALLDRNTFQYGSGMPARSSLSGIPSGDTGGEAGFNGGGALPLEVKGFSGYGNAYYLDIYDASLPRTIWLYAMYFRNQARVTPGPVNLARPVVDYSSDNNAFDGYHIGGKVYFSLIVDDGELDIHPETIKRLQQEERRERYQQFLKKEQEERLNRTLKEQQKTDEDDELDGQEVPPQSKSDKPIPPSQPSNSSQKQAMPSKAVP